MTLPALRSCPSPSINLACLVQQLKCKLLSFVIAFLLMDPRCFQLNYLSISSLPGCFIYKPLCQFCLSLETPKPIYLISSPPVPWVPEWLLKKIYFFFLENTFESTSMGEEERRVGSCIFFVPPPGALLSSTALIYLLRPSATLQRVSFGLFWHRRSGLRIPCPLIACTKNQGTRDCWLITSCCLTSNQSKAADVSPSTAVSSISDL